MINKIILSQLAVGFEDYTKAELEKTLKGHALIFLERYEKELREMGLRSQAINLFRSKKVLRKSDLIVLCSLPFLTKRYYKIWKASLDSDVRNLWDLMIWEDKKGEDEIFETLEVRISQKKKASRSYYSYGNDIKLNPKFALFKAFNSGSWHNPKVGIGIPVALRMFLVKYYDLPEEAKIKTEEKIESTEYVFENSDQVLLSELSRIYLYYSQKNIAVTGKDRPKHTSIPKMQKTLNLREFFPEEKDKKLKILRTNMLAGLIVQMGHRIKLKEPIPYIKDGLFKNSFLKKADTVALILTDLKGMGYLDGYDFFDVENPLFEKVKEFPEGWISIERIEKNWKFQLLPGKIVSEYKAEDKLHFQYEEEYEDNGKKYRYKGNHQIGRHRYNKSITKPYLRGYFFMLSALGLFDLAYNRPNREVVGLTCQSAYDDLKYIRFTPLGLYLTGKSGTYEVPEGLGETKFVFSPDALTITLDGADTSAGFVLEPYASKVTPNRFATDTQTFLKGIKKKKELEHKISLFRQVTKVEMPQNWEDFFTDMLQKVDPFESPKEDFIIYKLPESNKNLMKLVAQDKYLKSYSLKAEGYHVLVPKSKLLAFKKRLLEFGYLVT